MDGELMRQDGELEEGAAPGVGALDHNYGIPWEQVVRGLVPEGGCPNKTP